jgi:hypothetical protein
MSTDLTLGTLRSSSSTSLNTPPVENNAPPAENLTPSQISQNPSLALEKYKKKDAVKGRK